LDFDGVGGIEMNFEFDDVERIKNFQTPSN
jgi:hypothetical protein